MAEVTRRRTGEFLRVLFRALLDHPDGMQARDAIDAVRGRMTLSEYERGEFPTGGVRFDKILRFATVNCVKAGWIVKQKGRWTVTKEGGQAFAAYENPEIFYKEAVKLYNQWKANQPDVSPEQPGKPEAAPGPKAVSITFEQAEEQAWSEIEQYLRAMNPYDLRNSSHHYCARWVTTCPGSHHLARTGE